MRKKITLLSASFLLIGCNINTITNKAIDNSIKESIKPTSSPIVQQTTQATSLPSSEPSNSPIINNSTSKRIYTDKSIYINGTNIKVDIDKISKFNSKFSKFKLNNKGNGFITFYTEYYDGSTSDIVQRFYNGIPKEKINYALIKDYKVVTDSIEDDFDAISIDDNGNGIVYSYNRATKNQVESKITFTNEISYRKVSNYIISNEKNIIETSKYDGYNYNPPHLILNSNGTGTFYDFRNKVVNNTIISNKQELFVRKVTNFIPEKEYIKVLDIESDDNYYLRVNLYNRYINTLDKLDSNGNGNLVYDTNYNKIGIIPIRNYDIDFMKSVIVTDNNIETYPNTLDINGNGENLYFQNTNEGNLNLILKTVKNYKDISTTVIKDFQNNITSKNSNINLTNYYLSNGNGFIIWSEYDTDKKINTSYIQDIKDYRLI